VPVIQLIKERVVSFDYNARVKTGIILMIALALFSNFRSLWEWIQFDLSFMGQDDITKFEEKFEVVKSRLPKNGIIGFRTDNPNDLAQYYKTQYALTPRVIARIPGQKLVISLNSNELFGPGGEEMTVSSSGEDFKMYDFHNGVRIILSDEQ
jgi:hypothetical protein